MDDYGKYGDDRLVKLAAEGDGRAMKEVYDRYVEYLSAVCARYISDGNDRKDVLQECFVRIFTSLGRFRFRGEGSLRAWMIRIVVNESLRFLKKTASYDFIDYEPSLPDVPEEPEVDGIPDDVVNDMILSLPPGYRMVFNLYVLEEMPHKDIAVRLGITEGTSKSNLARARDILKRKIKEYLKNEI